MVERERERESEGGMGEREGRQRGMGERESIEFYGICMRPMIQCMCAVYYSSNCLIEDGIVEWFREIDFGKYIKKFVESGYNQFSEIAIITEDQMKTIVSQSINTRSILCPNCILILYSYNTYT